MWHPSIGDLQRVLQTKFCPEQLSEIENIEGSFLVVYRRGRRIYIFCDKYSIQRVYYAIDATRVTLSDKLLEDFQNLAISPQNATQFAFLQFVPGRCTLFDKIYRLMPCECLVLDLDTKQCASMLHFIYGKRKVDAPDITSVGQTTHNLFRQAVQMRIQKYPTSNLLVPLSGGLDSRYILATLMELVSPNRITAVTFGSLGTYDYEIGAQVAKVVGVKHVAYPLSVEDYRDPELLRNGLDAEGQVNFITEAPLRVFEEFEAHGTVVVSGFVGDAIMGSKAYQCVQDQRDVVVRDSLVDDRDLCAQFLDSDTIADGFYYETGEDSSLTTFEQWFFVNHFTKYTNYCVFKNRNRLKYISPFIDYELCEFVLNIPREMRLKRAMYFRECCNRFPQLAGLPFKSYMGSALSASLLSRFIARQWDKINYSYLGIDKRANYISFHKHVSRIAGGADVRKGGVGLRPELLRTILEDKRCVLMRYNLRCLQLLSRQYDISLQ